MGLFEDFTYNLFSGETKKQASADKTALVDVGSTQTTTYAPSTQTTKSYSSQVSTTVSPSYSYVYSPTVVSGSSDVSGSSINPSFTTGTQQASTQSPDISQTGASPDVTSTTAGGSNLLLIAGLVAGGYFLLKGDVKK